MPNLKGKASNIFEKFQAVREYKAGALKRSEPSSDYSMGLL